MNILLNESYDSFFTRFAASALVALSFVEGRQITQEDDITITTLAGAMSLGAYALAIAHAYYRGQEIAANPGARENLKRVCTILLLAGTLIKITCLRVQFFNPTEFLDRHHPTVWNYLSYCGATLAACALLEGS